MSFDRLAKFYGAIEAVCAGRLMQRARAAQLDACPETGHVLLLGEGHGKTLAALRRLRPRLDLTYFDASPAMERLARRRLERAPAGEGRITFLSGNALSFPFGETRYDVIVTPFFLDCFSPAELARLIPRLTSLARPSALWLVADFQLPAAGWRRRRAMCVLALLHTFFRIAGGISARRWTDPAPFLMECGWVLQSRKTFSLDLLRSDMWETSA